MKMLTDKDVRAIVRTVMSLEKGKACSEFDACFKRGYRAACRRVVELLDQDEHDQRAEDEANYITS